MATKWISPTWRMPEENNQSKFDNYSLDFDGSSEYVEISDSTLLNGKNAVSISMWVNPAAQGIYDAPLNYYSFANGGNNKIGFSYVSSTNNYFRFTLQAHPTLSYVESSTNSIPLNQWTHVVGVGEAGQALKIYINGVEDNATQSGTMPTLYQDANLFIGKDNGAAGRNFNGKINHVSIFDYALSETQIKYLYNNNDTVNPTVANPQNPMAIPGNTPVAYYGLGGSSTGDASSTPNTLTVPNSSVPSATVFDFNGSAYIDLNKVDLGVASTVSMWVNLTGTYSYALLGEDSNLGTYALYIDSSAIYFRVQNSTLIWYNSSDVTSGNWHNILITRSSSNQGELFIDGQSKGIDPTWTNGDPGTTSTKFDRIGARHTGLNSVQGEIANVQAWNTDLDQTQITEVYNNGVPLLSGIQPQAANLKAWWKMNVDTSSWNGNDWTISDTSVYWKNSLGFNGNSSILISSTSSPYNPKIDASQNFSMSFWIRSTFTPSGSYTTRHFSRLIGTGINADIIRVKQGAPPFLGGGTNYVINSNTNVYGTTTLNDGIWHNVVLTYDSSTGDLLYYVDGTPEQKYNSSDDVTGNYASGGDIRINLGGNTNNQRWIGQMSNCTLFEGSKLTPSEISTLYNNGVPEVTPSFSPTSWWKLDNTTTGIQDSIGSKNGTNNGAVESNIAVSQVNGTSNGMTTANLVTSDLTRSIPYSSYSMYMTGSTDDTYFDLATDIVVGTSGNTTYSWSIWVKPIDDGFTSQVVVFGDSGATDDGSLVLERSGGNFTALVEQTGTELESSAGAVVNNVWTHIAIVVDSTASTKKMYINGQEDTAVGGTGAGPDGTIKNINSSNTFNQYTGNVSNWAFWNSALSDDNILSIYNGGAPNDLTNLNPTHWWSMSGDSYFNGSNWICPDLIGSNNLTGVNDSGEELVGDGPGSEANGVGTSMNIPGNLQGNAPNSTANAFSINMNAADRVEDVAPTP